MFFEYKPCGLTMKQFLESIKLKYDKQITYTARLDPMAQGIVSIIEKDDFKNIKNKINTKKVYTVSIIFGISTDSDDVLGLIENIKNNIEPKDYIEYFEKKNYSYDQKYHYFSSKRISNRYRNKPDISSTHQVTIFKSKVLNLGSYNIYDWIDKIIDDINKVDKNSDFRQNKIKKQWKDLKKNFTFKSEIKYIDLELNVSSGFFVRQFIRDISEKINYPLLAYKITRKQIY